MPAHRTYMPSAMPIRKRSSGMDACAGDGGWESQMAPSGNPPSCGAQGTCMGMPKCACMSELVFTFSAHLLSDFESADESGIYLKMQTASQADVERLEASSGV